LVKGESDTSGGGRSTRNPRLERGQRNSFTPSDPRGTYIHSLSPTNEER
jgi:hypothetical protein